MRSQSSHAPEIGYAQRDQCLGSIRRCDKLDLERVRSIDLHDCPKITPTKAIVGNVAR